MSWKDFATATEQAVKRAARYLWDAATATMPAPTAPGFDAVFRGLVETLCARAGQDAVRAVFEETCDARGKEFTETLLRRAGYDTVQAWADACCRSGPAAVDAALRSMSVRSDLEDVRGRMVHHIDGTREKP